MINDFLIYCEQTGLNNIIYGNTVKFGCLLQFIFLMGFNRKLYDLTIKKTAVIIVLFYPAMYYLMLTIGWVENGFSNWGANNFLKVFIWIPLLALPIAKLIREPFSKLTDYIAPCVPLQHAIGKLACGFAGCCYGYECSWGVYQPGSGRYLFPIQWVECVVALAISFGTMYCARHHHEETKRKLYPFFLILFGSTRFLLEFLRDNNKLFLGISGLALNALSMILVGGFWLYVLKHPEKFSRFPIKPDRVRASNERHTSFADKAAKLFGIRRYGKIVHTSKHNGGRRR